MIRISAFLLFCVFSLFQGTEWFRVFSCLKIYENDVDINTIVIFPYLTITAAYCLLLWFVTRRINFRGCQYLLFSVGVIVFSIALPGLITLIFFEISSLTNDDFSRMLGLCDI